MGTRLAISLALVLFALAPAPGMGQGLRGSGHTTLPVGNYSNGSILPTGQVITPTAAPGSTLQVLRPDCAPTGMRTPPKR